VSLSWRILSALRSQSRWFLGQYRVFRCGDDPAGVVAGVDVDVHVEVEPDAPWSGHAALLVSTDHTPWSGRACMAVGSDLLSMAMDP